MNNNTGDKAPIVSRWKISLAVAIGVGVSAYLIATTFKPGPLLSITFSSRLLIGLIAAALTVVVRDFAFMYKIRLSTGEVLSWKKTLQLIIMWEFGAAITPKLGEVAFTLYILKKSGLSYGRSMAAIMLNAFLDNLAFIVLFSTLYLIIGSKILVVSAACPDLLNHAVMQKLRYAANFAWIGYVAMLSLSLFLFAAIFIIPKGTHKFFSALARLGFLSRVKNKLQHFADEIQVTSHEYRQKGFGFWLRMCIATLVNWSARYALANALLFAFSDVDLNMLEVHARQYVLWVFIIIPTTPGASGVAEIMFMALNCEFIPTGLGAAVTTVWRMYSYYLYLIAGMLILRKWVKDSLIE